MSTLEGKPIADTYKDLLQISNNNSGADITLLPVEDGEGTQTALSLSTSMIGIAGHIIPSTNAAYDIGSAEYKIRHLFLSDNSLYVGDFQLSSSDVQEVKKLADGEYATTAQLTTQSDKVNTALQPGGVDFTTDLVNVPTTLDGYGIVDAATKLQGDLAEEAAAKANTALQPGGVSFTSDITNIPTTLAGYGITEITIPEQKLEHNSTIIRRQSFDLGAFKRRVHVQLDNNTSMKVSICSQRDGVDNSLLFWDGYINNNSNTSYCTEIKSVRTNGTNSAYTFSKTDAIENEPCNFYWDFNESPEVGNGVIIVEAIKGDCIISISDHDQIIDMTDSSNTDDSGTGDSGTGDSGPDVEISNDYWSGGEATWTGFSIGDTTTINYEWGTPNVTIGTVYSGDDTYREELRLNQTSSFDDDYVTNNASAVFVDNNSGLWFWINRPGAYTGWWLSNDLGRIPSGTGDSGTGDSGTGDSGTGDSGTGDSGTGDSGTGDSSSVTVQNFLNNTGLTLTEYNQITGADWIDYLALNPVDDYSAITASELSQPMNMPNINMDDGSTFGMDTGGEYYLTVDPALDFGSSRSLYFEPDTGLSQMLILQEGYGVMFFNEESPMDSSYGSIQTTINFYEESSYFMQSPPISDAIEIEGDEYAMGGYTNIMNINLNVYASPAEIIQGIEDNYQAQNLPYKWGYIVVQYSTA